MKASVLTPLVLLGGGAVTVCTSEFDSDVRETSGTLVVKEGIGVGSTGLDAAVVLVDKDCSAGDEMPAASVDTS